MRVMVLNPEKRFSHNLRASKRITFMSILWHGFITQTWFSSQGDHRWNTPWVPLHLWSDQHQKDCLGQILWENPAEQIFVMAFSSSWQMRVLDYIFFWLRDGVTERCSKNVYFIFRIKIRICTSSFPSKQTEQFDVFLSSMCANSKICILKFLHCNLTLFRGFDFRDQLIALL